MNELIGSFAGKRLAAFGALIAAIALLAAGGALSTAVAQDADAPMGAPPDATGRAGDGLDHVRGGEKQDILKITLAVNTRHEVCLVEDIDGTHQFRADSGNSDPAEPNADPPTELAAGDTPGDPEDIDNLEWSKRADPTGLGGDPIDVGPVGVLSMAPSASNALSENPATGWNWMIAKKANTPGTPTISNPRLTFPNANDAGEACIFWTSSAPGTQVIRLYQDSNLAAVGANVVNIGAGRDSDFSYSAATQTDRASDDWKLDDPSADLEVTWVDSDPLIRLARLGLPTAPLGAAVTAPIAQRMVLTGGGATQAFQPAGATPATIQIRVEAIQSAVVTQSLSGASVAFAVTGNCGAVTVPGAVVSAGPPRVTDTIKPGQTGTVANWGTAPVTATFSNVAVVSEPAAPTDVPACTRPNSSTTLTVTSGAATATATVNWNWDGYGEYTLEDVDDTTKKVTFHTAIPRTYVLGQPTGWTCDTASQGRQVLFDMDGRASVTGFARRNTVNAGAAAAQGPTFTVVSPTSQGATTPKRTLGAQDRECQVSWTIKSPARSDDVYLEITTIGVDAFSQQDPSEGVLSFAPEAPAVTTFDDLEVPLTPGNSQVIWTGGSTAVADAVGDSGATAVYLWVNATQSWLAFFPGQEGLGVNSLTMLSNGDILFVSTPSN